MAFILLSRIVLEFQNQAKSSKVPRAYHRLGTDLPWPVLATPSTSTMVEKSPSDDRDYLYAVLPNGMKVLAIHDPDADKAACSMNVGIGAKEPPPTTRAHTHTHAHTRHRRM